MRNPVRAITGAVTDPDRRARLILWLLVVSFAFAGVFAGSQLVTSTPWFCNDVCHNVHADNAKAWAAGSHANVNCVACHYEPNMNAGSFILDRVDKLVDIPPTIANSFPMPLNGESHMALTVTNEQCEQCHDINTRRVSPSRGVLINHQAHVEKGVNCTACHNRVAHPEKGFDLTLPGNKKKEDWMKMTACFRCHQQPGVTLAAGKSEFSAPGECATCHPKDFPLKPETHDAKNWMKLRGDSKAHAKAALGEFDANEEAVAEWEAAEPELAKKQPRVLARIAGVKHVVQVHTVPSKTVNECFTCHEPKYCTNCHGTEIPHPENFREQHSKKFKEANAVDCAKCHNKTGSAAYDGQSCHLCHHKPEAASRPWRTAHDERARRVDIEKDCYSCHKELFCSTCHVRGEPATPY
ncbi:MAG: hypothetical protein HY876_10185 [Coriobacteriales bacterium]|nr:hypothetical protein [Coriobacteriales bacterium]